jgi:hypothetical protein
MFLIGEESGRPTFLLPHPEHYQHLAQAPLSAHVTRNTVDRVTGERQIRTQLRTEGGARVVDPERVSVTEETIRRSILMEEFAKRADVLRYMTSLFGLPVVVLDTPGLLPGDHPDLC